MGSFSIWHWLIVLAVVLLLFGRGKIPELMGDVAKGIKNFKQGMNEDETKEDGKTIENDAEEAVRPAKKTTKS
ncbi:twin-arginine translocase TatA/TatE family subunit [Paenochrobactrum sp. BZR 588]|uniref:twin-arginine translocase TatA/TatE family subunit n=1 Tax=Paenochrobactrum TaxID=999488 RepID=UPI0035BBE209